MRKLHALVELHLDVGAQQPLDLHRAFGRQLVLPAVDVRLEHAPPCSVILRILDSDMIWKPPESVRIGPLPADERVKPAELRDLLRTGPQHQVIGVAEDDVGARRLHLVEVEALDRADRAHRHEGGRADVAMQRVNRAKAGRAVGGVKGEAEFYVRHAAGNSRLASP